MAFDTYTNFRTAVRNWLNVGDLTTTAIDDLVTVAENRVNDELWVNERETALNVTINGSSAAIPADYDRMKHAYLDSTPIIPLQKKSAEWIYQNYIYRSESGRPAYYAEEAGSFIFGPIPDSAYVMKGVYYKKPASLSGTSTVNAVFSAYPEVYLYACLSAAELYLGRDQRMGWEAEYQKAINRVTKSEQRRLFSGSPLAVTPG